MINNFSLAQPAIKSQIIQHSDKQYSLIIEPLLPGYGYTLGNSLRRILLSSTPGFAVTRIKINDITHEYQTIEGVVEDAMDVVLNIKQLRAKIITDDDKVTLTLSKNAEGEVTASDFTKNAKVEIVNSDLYICYLNNKHNLNIEVDITRGTGYLTVEEINLAGSINPQDILVDAVFTPVTNVSLEVEKVRVADNTNYDKLQLNFDTDGSIEAVDVVEFALHTVVDIFQKVQSSLEVTTSPVQATLPTATDTNSKDLDVITLPSKIKSILEKNGITTNQQLRDKIEEVPDYSGISTRSLQTIQDYLKELG